MSNDIEKTNDVQQPSNTSGINCSQPANSVSSSSPSATATMDTTKRTFRQQRYSRTENGDNEDTSASEAAAAAVTSSIESSTSTTSQRPIQSSIHVGNHNVNHNNFIDNDTNDGDGDNHSFQSDDPQPLPGAYRISSQHGNEVALHLNHESRGGSLSDDRYNGNSFDGDDLVSTDRPMDDSIHHREQSQHPSPIRLEAVVVVEPITATMIDESKEEEIREQIRHELKEQLVREGQEKQKLPAASSSSWSSSPSLAFDELSCPLHGRDYEIRLLKNCLDRMTASTDTSSSESSRKRQCVMLRGQAGVGKTSLVEQTLKSEVRDHKGVFVSGKFDLRIREEPFSGVTAIVRAVCKEILSLPRGAFNECQAQIIDVLGVAIGRFVQLVPDMEQVVGAGHRQYDDACDGQDLSSRLNDVFLGFFRVVASTFCPIVCFFDDIQWADDASLALMTALMRDDMNQNLMVVASYRSEDVTFNRKISTILSEFRRGAFYEIELTEITVRSLRAEVILEYLSDLLGTAERKDEIHTLASICHRRTGGNAVYLRAFLMDLHQKRLLKYDIIQKQWQWDIQEIEECTEATSNVTQLLQNKIAASFAGHTAKLYKKLLTMAACLGASFSETTLHFLWRRVLPSESDSFDVREGLEMACEEGFIESKGNASFRFVHDCLREAFLALESVNDLLQLRERMGWTLVAHGINAQSDIFLVLNLLQDALSPSDDGLRLAVARLYLRATERCKMMAIYLQTHSYAKQGLRFLDEKDLEVPSSRKLFLDLYISAARGALFNGDDSSASTYCSVIEARRDLSLVEKLPFFLVTVELRARRANLNDAVKLSLDLLDMLGYKIPRTRLSQALGTGSCFHQIRSLQKTILSRSGVDDLPLVGEDSVTKTVFVLLSRLSTYAYLAGDHLLCLLSCFVGTQLTFDEGISEESSNLVSCFGLFCMHMLGNWESGVRSAELSLDMLEKMKQKSMTSRAILAANVVLSHTRPMNDTLPQFFLGYEKGIEYGDSEMASYNFGLYLCGQLLSGAPIQSVAQEAEDVLPKMESWKNEEPTSWVRSVLAAVQVFGGDLSMDELVRSIEEAGQTDSTVQQVYPSAVLNSVYLYLEEYDLGAELACENGPRFHKRLRGLPIGMMDNFVQGMCLYAAAKTANGRKRRRYLSKARTRKAIVERWERNGNPNVIHQVKLLKAEDLVFTVRKNRSARYPVIQLYTEAKLLARENGFLQDEALAHERLALYLKEVGDIDAARTSLEAAIDTYRRWGAHRKVDLLEARLSNGW